MKKNYWHTFLIRNGFNGELYRFKINLGTVIEVTP